MFFSIALKKYLIITSVHLINACINRQLVTPNICQLAAGATQAATYSNR